MPLGDSAESMGAFVWIEATSPAGGGKDSRRPPEGAGGVAAVGRGVAHGANAVPDGPDWLHEIKYDDYRLRVERDGDRVRLITRGGYDWTKRYTRGSSRDAPEAQ
jgi:hypothetical protein